MQAHKSLSDLHIQCLLEMQSFEMKCLKVVLFIFVLSKEAVFLIRLF